MSFRLGTPKTQSLGLSDCLNVSSYSSSSLVVVVPGNLRSFVVQALEEQLQVLALSRKVHLAERCRWVGLDREGWGDGQQVDRATRRACFHEVGMVRALDRETGHRHGKRVLCLRSTVFGLGLRRGVRCARRIPLEQMGGFSPDRHPRSRIVLFALFAPFALGNGNDCRLRS